MVLCFERWIPGCKFPQAVPLALRQLSDFIRLSQCLRHATPNAIASRRVRTSDSKKIKCPGMTRKKIKCPGMTVKKQTERFYKKFIPDDRDDG